MDKKDKSFPDLWSKKDLKKTPPNRWIFQVLSPVNKEVIWEYQTPFSRTVADKWFEDTGNRYLSRGKVNRLCSGEVGNEFLNVIKIEK